MISHIIAQTGLEQYDMITDATRSYDPGGDKPKLYLFQTSDENVSLSALYYFTLLYFTGLPYQI
jgi:hypothetical protein